MRMGKGTGMSESDAASHGHNRPLSPQKMRAIADFERGVHVLLNDRSTETGSQSDVGIKVMERNRTKACAIAAKAIGVCLAWAHKESAHGKIFLLQKAFSFATNARGKLPLIESALREIDVTDISQERKDEFVELMHAVANATIAAMAESSMSPRVRLALLGMEMSELRRRNPRRYTLGYEQ